MNCHPTPFSKFRFRESRNARKIFSLITNRFTNPSRSVTLSRKSQPPRQPPLILLLHLLPHFPPIIHPNYLRLTFRVCYRPLSVIRSLLRNFNFSPSSVFRTCVQYAVRWRGSSTLCCTPSGWTWEPLRGSQTSGHTKSPFYLSTKSCGSCKSCYGITSASRYSKTG